MKEAIEVEATLRLALERIADPRNTHFAGDAQVVAREALAQQSPQRSEDTKERSDWNEQVEPVAFTYWFYNEPHRQKYTTDHPAFLAAQEAWEFQEKRKGIPSGFIRSLVFIDENGNESFKDELFYTSPPTQCSQRSEAYKPLTDGQVTEIYNQVCKDWTNRYNRPITFARAIEAARGIHPTGFKEKNNGS